MLFTGAIFCLLYVFYLWLSEDSVDILSMLFLAGPGALIIWIFDLSFAPAFYVMLISMCVMFYLGDRFFDKENKN